MSVKRIPAKSSRAEKMAGKALEVMVVCLFSVISGVGSEEYCLEESFKASCAPGEVIVMEHAHFGRLSLGRCITRNYGHVGCYKDVIGRLDTLCSGKQTCEQRVADEEIIKSKPCPPDFSSYLDASYTCLQVDAPVCDAGPRHQVSSTSGYISSLHHPREGGPCVYELDFPQGQKVNLTLMDFTLRNESLYGNKHLKFCQQYAIIEEPTTHNSITVCGGEVRRKHVYTSRTSHVIIRLVSTDSARFIFKYEAVGCSTIPLPEGTYSRMEEDALFIICNVTGESFLLRCRHNAWVGELKNCSVPAAIENTKPTDSPVGFGGMPPLGISVVIIFGVAMVIVVYIAIMIVCVLFIRRRKRRRRRAEAEAALSKIPVIEDPYGTVLKGVPKVGAEERLPMLGKPLHRANGGEYTDICEMHEIGNCLDFHSNYIRGTLTLPCSGGVSNYGQIPACGAPNPSCGNQDVPCTTSVESLRCHGDRGTQECVYSTGGSRAMKSFQVAPPPAKPPKHGVYFHPEPLDLAPPPGPASQENPYGRIVKDRTEGDYGTSNSPDLVPDSNNAGGIGVSACPRQGEEGHR